VFAITLIVGGLAALLFAAAAQLKLADRPMARQGREKLGFSAAAYKRIGALELLGVAGLLVGFAVPAIGVAAGVGLVALTVGAIVNHRRVGDPADAIMVAVVAMVLAAAYVGFRLLSVS
jgi:hypothetical protein